jgi:hypothetical protein
MTVADIKIAAYQDAIDLAHAAGVRAPQLIAKLEDRIHEVADAACRVTARDLEIDAEYPILL